MRFPILLAVLLAGFSCASNPNPPADGAPTELSRPTVALTQPAIGTNEHRWLGVYASTSEIGGFSGTVLELRPRDDGSGSAMYRMRSYTDARQAGAIRQDEQFGDYLTDGDALYLPDASGCYDENGPKLVASITRYTLVEINGRIALMRDDSLKAFRRDDKLYDYGVLLKVSDWGNGFVDLTKVKHPSIKLLYADPNKPWADPFVQGRNGR